MTSVHILLFISSVEYTVDRSVTDKASHTVCFFLSLVYTVFAFLEYMIVVSNIAFHVTFVYDHPTSALMFGSRRLAEVEPSKIAWGKLKDFRHVVKGFFLNVFSSGVSLQIPNGHRT